MRAFWISGMKYYLVFLLAPVAFAGLSWGGVWSFALPIVIFGLIPLLEVVLEPNWDNLPAASPRPSQSRLYDWATYLLAPTQYALLVWFLTRATAQTSQPLELAGMTLTMGICTGIFGINVAHELGHRHRRFEQALAKALLLTGLYLHFFIEHNRGHHAKVATPQDPASARMGESLPRFWVRSLWGSYCSAWRLENRRLERRGQSPFSLRNQMLRFQVYQAALVAGVGLAFGLRALAFFLVQALIGVLLLETVNYIEHYGLSRRLLPNGRYEPVSAHHSWNSEFPLGRLLLFELTRHSDHHLNAHRKYPTLRNWRTAPQMPAGYPAMVLLAAIPPLWFRVMDERAGAHSGSVASETPPAPAPNGELEAREPKPEAGG